MRILPLLALLGCSRACAVGSVVPARQLSVEAVPGRSTPLGQELDFEAISYDEAEALTREAQREVLPDLLLALDLDEREVDQDLGPGGYQLATNPALQLKVPLSDEEATRLAAALGLAWRQESVLLVDWSEGDGGTAYAGVRFTGAAPSAEEAQAFFEWAAEGNPGLGGGYTAYDDTLYFLNLRGADGEPYSGLDDASFVALLDQAARSWTEGAVALSESGELEAWLVENDWSASPEGEGYLATIEADPSLEAALEAAASEHEQLVERAADEGGWWTEPR